MKVINKSRKIIGINGDPLLPGAELTLPDGMENHPVISFYLGKGILVDANNVSSSSEDNITDDERKRIAEEAIAKYKAEQEESEKAAIERESAIKAVKGMNKNDLLTKAAGMGLEINDDDKVETIREKIITELDK